jgi:hypothetical protein
MINLKGSKWGIIVDKSNPTKNYDIRETPYTKGSRLNYIHDETHTERNRKK